MAKKEQPITQALNLELSKIDSCLTIAKTILAEPDLGKQRAKLVELIEEAERAQQRAYDHLCTIMVSLKNL